jgi:hypothetical protein
MNDISPGIPGGWDNQHSGERQAASDHEWLGGGSTRGRLSEELGKASECKESRYS